MSCGGPHETPCHDVMHALVLFIDNELQDSGQVQALNIHFQECPPCKGTLEQEKAALSLLQSLLGRSCQEAAPEDLKAKIFAQTEELAAQMNLLYQNQIGAGQFGAGQFGTSQFFSEYTRTEITVDGVTQIIETSHEIRGDFSF